MGKTKQPSKTDLVFLNIRASFMHGLIRVQDAEIAMLMAQVAVRSKALPQPDGHPLWRTVDQLATMTLAQYDAFRYVSKVSVLVYATALFDAFLSETTRFLLLVNPSALGDEAQLRLEAVLKARSKADVLNLAIGKRVRDLSHQSFRERLRFLRERFGLRPKLSQKTGKALDHYSSLRNTVVHEQGFFQAKLNGRGKLIGQVTRCPSHPTPLRPDDLKEAKEVYLDAVDTISNAVLVDVLKLRHAVPPPAAAPEVPR